MKRVLRFLIGLFALPVGAFAQTAIGYTNGDFDHTDGVNLGPGTTQSAAIRIPAAKLEQLAGAKVTAINGVFGSRNLASVKFFVTDKLGGKPLYEQQLSGFSTRWQTFQLTTPYELTAGRDLYFGFEVTIGDGMVALGFDRQNCEPGCNFGFDGEKWVDLTSATYGNLNLQLMVEGAPQFTDATVRPFRAEGFYRTETQNSFQGQLFNFGTQPITSFDVAYSVDGGEEHSQTVSGVSVAPGEVYNFDVDGVEAADYGNKNITFNVTNVNGGTETLTEDNARSTNVFFYPKSMPRNILIENFTGAYCSNCPEGHRAMERAVSQAGDMGVDIVEVAYHGYPSPYDAFAMTEDSYYMSFFGAIGAPAFMVNRFANPNVDATNPTFALSGSANTTAAMMLDGIRQQAAVQPYVGIYANTNYDEATRRLTGTIDVVAYRKPEMSNPSLTVLLVQDSIRGFQIGNGYSYLHHYVNRGSLNGIFGEKMTLEEGSVVTKVIDYTLPDGIVSTRADADTAIAADPKQMYLVAIVSNYNSDDPTDCLVLNSVAVKFGTSTVTGISEAPAAPAAVEARLVGPAGSLRAEGDFDALYIYNVGGKLAARCSEPGQTLSLTPGVYITRAVKDGAVSTGKCVVAR